MEKSESFSANTDDEEIDDVWIRDSDGDRLTVAAIEDSSSLLMMASNGRYRVWPLIALDACGYKRKRQKMGHNVEYGNESEREVREPPRPPPAPSAYVAGVESFRRQVAAEKEKHNNPINHPAHYAAGRKFEPIDVIRDWDLNFSLGNAVKYVSRAGRKDPLKTVEDLKKAIWYIQNEIDSIEKSK